LVVCALLLIIVLTAKPSVQYVCQKAGSARFAFALGDGTQPIASPYETCFNVEFPETVLQGTLPDDEAPPKLIKDNATLMKTATRSPPQDAVLINTPDEIYAAQHALTLFVCFQGEPTTNDACNPSNQDVAARTLVGGQCGKVLGGYPCVPRSFTSSTAQDPSQLTPRQRAAVVQECRSYGRFPGQMCNQNLAPAGQCKSLPKTTWNGVVCGTLAGALVQTSATPSPSGPACQTSCCT